MCKRKTTEQFKREVYDLVGNEYKVLGKYKNANTKIELLHVPYNHKWNVTPHNFLCGQRCAKEKNLRISEHNKLSYEHVKEYIDNSDNHEYKLLSHSYKNAKTKLRVKHLVCGKEYLVNFSDFKSGRRCPRCAFYIRTKKETKSLKQFKQEVFNLVGNEYLVVSDFYTDWKTNLEFYHNKCKHHFSMQPNSFLQGRRCPFCYGSHGESWIVNYLDHHKIKYEYQKTFDDLKDIQCLSYDFYLPDENMLIEYQGKQHYKAIKHFGGNNQFRVQQKHDQMKRNYAEKHEYQLVSIPYLVNSYVKLNNFLDMIFINNVKYSNE